jgi:diadenosine tetraphosphatase ApaH/serine/threonine PP2A family protein phosphatase
LRYAVLADVHANLEALDAVLDAARAAGAERVVCAGDLVGYHADPDAVIARLRAASALCVAGNHDRVAAGLAEPTRFGPVARRAVLWTRGRLSPESRAFLAALPLHALVDDRFLLFHGALNPGPDPDLHLSSHARVARSIQALRDGPWPVRLAFFGHTHRGVVHESHEAGGWCSKEGPMISLSEGACYLVNPGSVGQPRDGDARASFTVLDTEARSIRFFRVPFDVGACLAKAVREGLIAADPRPPSGISRLVERGLAALRRLG